jgi:hypothetical protein
LRHERRGGSPKSFAEEASPALPPVLSIVEQHLFGPNGPTLGRLPLGPNRLQEPTGPYIDDGATVVPAFPCMPKNSARPVGEATPVQEPSEGLGLGDCLACLDASIARSLSEHDLDVRQLDSSFAWMGALDVPNREGDLASRAGEGVLLLVYARRRCGGPTCWPLR